MNPAGIRCNHKTPGVFLVILLFIFSGCFREDNSRKTEKLIIFHAGSLSVPISRMAEAFEKENPGVSIILEAAGSRECARKISELNKPCDIMASADYTVIDELLIPSHASWHIKFATNEMVLAFTEKSRDAQTIDNANWFGILQKKDIAYGRSNPDSDPCGYRTVLTLQLAEKYYGLPGLAGAILEKDRRYIRPKETDLLALLESHTLDYIFIYRSVAIQHGLRYLELPPEINLGHPSFSDYYHQASVAVSGRQPGEEIIKTGEPMVYGVTIIRDAPNRKLAEKFLKFMLDENKGRKILEEEGQETLSPPDNDYEKLIIKP